MKYCLAEIGKEYCNCGNLLHLKKEISHRYYFDEDGDFYEIQKLKFLTCPSCRSTTIVLYNASGNDAEDEYKHNDPQFEDYGRLYRRTILHGPPKNLHQSIPDEIADVVKQADSVLHNSSRACFILCRAALEEICNQFNIPSKEVGKNGKERFIGLSARLTMLCQQEKLPEDLRIIIEGIKNLGNEGAHSSQVEFGASISAKDASTLLDLLRYLLERLYVDKYRHKEAVKNLEGLKKKLNLP